MLRVLDACQRALVNGAIELKAAEAGATKPQLPYFVHESAYADEGAEIGAGSKMDANLVRATCDRLRDDQ